MAQIYLDNAATTKMSKTAIKAMLPYMDEIYGNPSSLHSVRQKAAEALTEARRRIAKRLSYDEKEIIFTSGGEANRIIKPLFLWRVLAREKARNISFPPHLNIMPYCIRWKS